MLMIFEKISKNDYRFRRVPANFIDFSEFEKFPIRKPFKTEPILCQKMLRIVGRVKNFELQCKISVLTMPFSSDLCRDIILYFGSGIS
jgi:hypothetical protein